jgi:hypothetical protein
VQLAVLYSRRYYYWRDAKGMQMSNRVSEDMESTG